MTHDERVHHHLYVDSKSPMENAERIASLEELVEELQAENARLRSQCADIADERERLFRANVEKNGEILRLVGENAKLRELVRDMCVWAYIDSDCDLENRFADRMRELGVDL